MRLCCFTFFHLLGSSSADSALLQNAMMFAQTEASRQKMRDMEREQGDQDDSTAKNGVEVIGETSSAADRG